MRLLSLLFLLIATVACHPKVMQTSEAPVPTGIPVVVEDATGLDGCTFLLVLADGKKLQPVNLDSAFQKDGMKLRVTWKTSPGMSICMSGTRVELISVNPDQPQSKP